MSGSEPRAGLRGEVLLELSRAGGEPVGQQLRQRLLDAIESGRLSAGDRLPPSRELAVDLGVSRGTVVDIYSQLLHEGYLVARQGSGTTVASRHSDGVTASVVHTSLAPVVAGDAAVIDLRPGAPDLAAFPRAAWSAALAHSLRNIANADLGYGPPWGATALREQLAGHLARTRHTVAGPDHVVVTTGVTQALTLTCRVLADRGHGLLAVEDPSNAVQRMVLRRHVPQLVNIPVDSEGLVVDALARTAARAVLVTPSHQHPTGVVLSPQRRAALLEWAARVDGLVIEDDYDAEFHYGRQAFPSLQGLDPARVLHAGSVSKTMAPGLRLGWLLAPPKLQAALLGAKRDSDFGSPVLAQHALARLLETGAYDKHLRRQRLRYRSRREALVRSLARHLPGWRVQGADAGLHLCALPNRDVDEDAVVASAASLGLLLLNLGRLRSGSGEPGFVLGYARLRESQADVAVQRLKEAVRLSRGPAPRRAAAPPLGAMPTVGRVVPGPATTSFDYFPPGAATADVSP